MTMVEQTPEPAPAKPKRKRAESKAVAVHTPQASVQVAPNPVSIVERAIEKGITGADLKEIMDLQERWEANQARKAFDVAMANAQAEMPVIVKNRHVFFEAKNGGKSTDYWHEDLAQVVDTIRPVLHKHGLAHRFRTEQFMRGERQMIKVTCIITGHGHREETSLESGPDSNGSGMNDIQRIKSAVTYLERTTLEAALGLAAKKDDDGRGTSEPVSTGITALQLQELEAMIKEVNANPANLCRACKPPIETLAQMTQSQFEKSMAKLETMRTPL
jgi:hypothetical protein